MATNTTDRVVATMSDYVNSFTCDYEGFAKGMGECHRTLQQNFTKLCVAWLRYLATTDMYDLRNQSAVDFAKSIKDKLDTVVLPTV
jgi:hypothetical protein